VGKADKKKTGMQVSCQSLCQYISMDTSRLARWIFSSYISQRFWKNYWFAARFHLMPIGHL